MDVDEYFSMGSRCFTGGHEGSAADAALVQHLYGGYGASEELAATLLHPEARARVEGRPAAWARTVSRPVADFAAHGLPAPPPFVPRPRPQTPARTNMAREKYGPLQLTDGKAVAFHDEVTRDLLATRRAFREKARSTLHLRPADKIPEEAKAYAATEFGQRWEIFDGTVAERQNRIDAGLDPEEQEAGPKEDITVDNVWAMQDVLRQRELEAAQDHGIGHTNDARLVVSEPRFDWIYEGDKVPEALRKFREGRARRDAQAEAAARRSPPRDAALHRDPNAPLPATGRVVDIPGPAAVLPRGLRTAAPPPRYTVAPELLRFTQGVQQAKVAEERARTESPGRDDWDAMRRPPPPPPPRASHMTEVLPFFASGVTSFDTTAPPPEGPTVASLMDAPAAYTFHSPRSDYSQ